MELHKALTQISEIHGHLAKSEVYKSGKSAPVVLSGLFAIVSALMQRSVLGAEPGYGFVVYWLAVAAVSLAMAGGVVTYNYAFCEGTLARRTTRRVVGQFLPSLVAGALVTGAVVSMGPGEVRLLPGCWAVLFSLGLFAARPYLPRAVGWVALYYLVAGAVLLLQAKESASLSPWGMAGSFGVGQIFAAVVLYWNLERKDDA